MPRLQLIAHDDARRGDLTRQETRNINSLDSFRAEIDSFYALMQEFKDLEIDEIFMSLAGISARVSEMRGLLQRMQTKAATNMKCQECDPLLAEVDRQFKDWSRSHQVKVDEWNMSGRST